MYCCCYFEKQIQFLIPAVLCPSLPCVPGNYINCVPGCNGIMAFLGFDSNDIFKNGFKSINIKEYQILEWCVLRDAA